MISIAAKEVSVHISRQEPLVGWITATKRTNRPAGRHSRSVYLIVDDDLALAVDGTFGLFEALGIIQQRPELDFAAIDPRPAPLA